MFAFKRFLFLGMILFGTVLAAVHSLSKSWPDALWAATFATVACVLMVRIARARTALHLRLAHSYPDIKRPIPKRRT
jgi:hypothetical protein